MAWGNPNKVLINRHEYGHLLLARDAAQMLVDAYERGGKWDDFCQAIERARDAIEQDRCSVCKKGGHK